MFDKKDFIIENQEKYVEEIRAKYTEDIINKSKERFENMSIDDLEKLSNLATEIKFYLAQAFNHKDPRSELAQKAAELHKEWVTISWGSYDKEAHAGLAQMYVVDERFKEYYDSQNPGTAEFLRDAIFIYTGVMI